MSQFSIFKNQIFKIEAGTDGQPYHGASLDSFPTQISEEPKTIIIATAGGPQDAGVKMVYPGIASKIRQSVPVRPHYWPL